MSPFQGQGSFVTQTTQRPYTNSPYIVPNPTTKDLTACTPSQPTSFTKQSSSQIHHSPHPFLRRPTENVSSQDKSPKAPTYLMKHLPSTQLHVLFNRLLHKAKTTSPCHPCLLLSRLPSWHLQSYDLKCPKESSSFIWNSGSSLSITNNKADFHGTLKPCPYKHLKVKGFAQAIKVHGQGMVLMSVLDEAGML